MNYKKTDRYIYRNIAGEGILVPVRDGICNLQNMLILNETSTALWEKMEQIDPIEPEAVVDWFLGNYAVGREQAKEDVAKLISDLIAERCLECNS